MELTFTQCKQLIDNGYDLRDFLKTIENQPEWIKAGGEIDEIAELQAIQQGGCASGAYTPAVTYHTANAVMGKYGDAVLDYVSDNYGELPCPPDHGSWSTLASFYLTFAVELWVGQFDLDGVDWD